MLPRQWGLSRTQLAEFFAEKGYTAGAEIGVWKGKFAAVLCHANPRLKLICVDPWSVQPDYLSAWNTKENMDYSYMKARKKLAAYDIRFIRKTSVDAAKEIPDGSLDFVYIDGNHRYENVAQDILAWVPKVRTGGVVSGHDYLTEPKNHTGVEQAVKDYTTEHEIDPWFVLQAGKDEPSWLWMVK